MISLARKGAVSALAFALVLGIALPAAAAARKRHAATPRANPYALVNGCFALRSLASGRYATRAGNGYAASTLSVGQAVPFHMQATALGQYILAGPDMNHPEADSQGGVTASPALDDPGVWRVRGVPGGSFVLSSLSTGRVLGVGSDGRQIVTGGPASGSHFAFTPTSGCVTPPEAQVGATGTAFRGASPISAVRGTIDAHTHLTAFEFIGGDFHCGRPWDPFGVTVALPDCASIQGPEGTAAPVQNFLDFGSPVHPHDTVGWPTFKDWPGPTRLTYEGSYYTGIKRAWLAGLRLVVTDLVDNEALCSIMTMRRNPCNDMASVHLQSRDLFALQNYVDAQSGGPGKGWFRIVTNPFQARQVINQGKLAVVEGIEVSRIFGCGEQNHVSQCNQSDVDQGLAEVRRLGVSSFYPVHKFDNAFGGTKMDGGALGAVINGGNHLETGHFWNVHTCTGPAHDSEQLTPSDAGSAIPGGSMFSIPGLDLGGTPLGQLIPGDATPVYPPGPHCNEQGLTDLGAYLINKMIDQHFLIEIDHMDAKTGDKALDLMEQRHYSGVVSPHNWSSPEQYPRIYSAGGFVTPIAGSSPESFVAQWGADKKVSDKRYLFGFGYGSDMNGLADQSAPTSLHPISYPFHAFEGNVTFGREQWGQRVFDLNTDGLANYGMYADWLNELQLLGGNAMMNDMFNGAEAYLETWERAYGVPAAACRSGRERFTSRGAGRGLQLGAGAQTLLLAAGQPTSRPGRSYRYCAAGGGQDTAVFDSHGRAALISSTARGARANGVGPGSPAARLRGRTAVVSAGIVQGRGSGGRFFYGVRGGRVRWVAAATAAEARDKTRLRADLRSAGL